MPSTSKNFSMPELIRTKRDGAELAPDALRWIIDGYTAGTLPDYQMSAFLMAVVFQGMSGAELAVWTEAMLNSGEVLDLSDLEGPKVDKHSTGGVGDKISIPLAPLVAACGVNVPMMSGRGLGHTGGTLDKLESIPGFRTALDPAEFRNVLTTHGLVLAGQSETLVPADRKIYGLRDATGTVPSVPLISSSIMSKKLAEGLDALVLDVKVGEGAFMKTIEDATTLARTMVDIGTAHGTAVVALLTNMSQPLGRTVGNANEVRESIEVLTGIGPADVTELVMLLGAEMLIAGGLEPTTDAARTRLSAAIQSGAAAERFEAVIAAQGGDPHVVADVGLLPTPSHTEVIKADRDGVVDACDALAVGMASVRLGGGRANIADVIDPAVGIEIHAKIGDTVQTGDSLATVGFNDPQRLAHALEVLESAWVVGDNPATSTPLLLDTVRPV